VLFTQRFWPGIADGSVTVAFRRWKRPTVKAGGTLRSPGGFLAIDGVRAIAIDDITETDARRAGYASRRELLDELQRRTGALYRIDFHLAGPDPRDVLRADATFDDAAWAELEARLDRLDRASTHGPWTREVIRLIASRPATRAPDLAAALGRETKSFKADVRKLKALGLTESLPVGYRLSPRGNAALQRVYPRTSAPRSTC
jgi:hypothetical protein